MHYDNKKIKDKAVLEVVIYKHILTQQNFINTLDYELCSIQKCHLIKPSMLINFYYKFEYLFHTQMASLDNECFYLFTFGWNAEKWEIEYIKHAKVTKAMLKTNPHLAVHE